MTQKTQAQLITEINQNFPDNTTGAITPALQRTTLTDMLNEAINVNVQVGSVYTIQDADNGSVVSFNSAVPVTVTLPNSSVAGFSILVEQEGVGTVTFAASAGATVHSSTGGLALTAQYSQGFLFVVSNSGGASAAWRLGGDTT